MKQKILFTGFFLTTMIFSVAQKHPLINVYAYAQATLSGTKPRTSSGENGNQITLASRENVNYFFYAEHSAQEKFSVTSLWIKGTAYGAKADSILKTPIEITGNDFKKITLVPATVNNVLILSPGSQVNLKRGCRLRKMLKKADLVITYIYNGKTRYYAVSKIKDLEVVPGI